MSVRVFVYGTLKRGEEYHDWLEGQHFITTAWTKPLYRMFNVGGYPGMVRVANGLAIEGEVWEVSEEGVSRLDLLEDVAGGEYERAAVELVGDLTDQYVESYLYLREVAGLCDVGTHWPPRNRT